jgi:hypothetical protein
MRATGRRTVVQGLVWTIVKFLLKNKLKAKRWEHGSSGIVPA